MALSDYRLCDLCGSKAFYDAKLNYEFPDKNGNDSYGLPMQYVKDSHHKLDYLGDWAVLCNGCSKTHKCVIVPFAVE